MAELDADLLARCAAGDVGALETIYRRHVERVWRYAWFRTHSHEAAADIVQETFLRVARAAGGFQGRSQFSTWLFAVARSVAVEHARREKRRRELATEPRVLRLVRPEPAALGRSMEDSEMREAVREAIARLPGPQRDAIVLCGLSGLNVREAAEVLGWGESRVKTTLFRARHRLRDMLQRYVGDRPREGQRAAWPGSP